MRGPIMRSRILILMILTCCFTVLPVIDLFAADDIYYLESEIKETERKYAPVVSDYARMDNFLNSYERHRNDLKKAYDELTALRQKVDSILLRNLVKSTLMLGFETYGKIGLVTGFAKQSILQIALACGSVG